MDSEPPPPTLSPQESSFEKLQNTRSSTLLSRAGTITSSSLKRAQTWASSVGAAIRPNITNNNGLTRVRTLEEFPNGYPKLSFVINSDDSFMMYRQFGQLHARTLLYKQDEIRELEQELAQLDASDDASPRSQLYLQCRADDASRRDGLRPGMRRSRQELMREIERQLLEYGKLLKQASRLQNMSRPSKRDHASVSNFIENAEPLVEDDKDFIYRKEDLVMLRNDGGRPWLDSVLESALNFVIRMYPSQCLRRAFSSKETQAKTSDPHFHYVEPKRISLLVTLLIALVVLPVTVVPIYILFWLTTQKGNAVTEPACIAVLLVSGFVFSLGLGVFTQAKRHEILTAAAGYCAILVVFVSNPQSPGSGGGSNGGQ